MRLLLRWSVCVLLVAIGWVLGTQIYSAFSLPTHLRLLPGQEFVIKLGPLMRAAADDERWLADLGNGGIALRAGEIGEQAVELRLFGIPVRRSQVDVVPRLQLVPGGEAVGVLMGEGVTITQIAAVRQPNGQERHPARDAGLRAGDTIVEIGGRAVTHGAQLEWAAQEYGKSGEPIPLVVEREGRRLSVEVMPAFDGTADGRYRLGVWIRDNAAGVGTLTFWDPVTRRYGALGHAIMDAPSQAAGDIPVGIGRIVPAQIQGINPGARGRPGEKIGLFSEQTGTLGSVDTNTPFGIYGTLDTPPALGQRQPLPVALAHEVEIGGATILTVLDGERIETFDVQITEVNRQSRPNDKGLVIRVTDPRLLERTNGIVQGMSGSPIIQNGYIVGAVTHVFVNDPHRGYGVLAEWMVYESGVVHPGGLREQGQQRPAA